MRVLYLYAGVMGYTMATVKALAAQNVDIHIVHWDHNKNSPYQVANHPDVHLYRRATLDTHEMYDLAKAINPVVVVLSGWMDAGYVMVAKRLRKEGHIVVIAFDTQWFGGPRQHVIGWIRRLYCGASYFDYAWVSGLYQYEFAQRLGFDRTRILFDLYSADTRLFEQANQEYLHGKESDYPHRLLFVGRFAPVKGLEELGMAWKLVGEKRRDWELHLIGKGPLKEQLQNIPGVIVKDFMQPEDLMRQVGQTGCFVLPSRVEPWGVVVHEFAAAGLPLILSDSVGAARTFLISGCNGYSFKAGDVKQLANKIEVIINKRDQDLFDMGRVSRQLSWRISPETSAANLLSVIRS